MSTTGISIIVALITSAAAAGIGALAGRRVNKADAADKLVAGAVALVELVQRDNANLHQELGALRVEVRSTKAEVDDCESKHERLASYLRQQGIRVPEEL